MRRRTVHASFGIVAAVCAAVAISFGVQLHHANQTNDAIANSKSNQSAVPEAQLAEAGDALHQSEGEMFQLLVTVQQRFAQPGGEAGEQCVRADAGEEAA